MNTFIKKQNKKTKQNNKTLCIEGLLSIQQ